MASAEDAAASLYLPEHGNECLGRAAVAGAAAAAVILQCSEQQARQLLLA